MSPAPSSWTGTTSPGSSPAGRSRSRSASSGACSRPCPRRPSSAGTGRPSRPEPTLVGVGCALYDGSDAATTAHREPRAHPGGGARALGRAERDHRGDRCGQDDPRPGGRAAARHERRRLVRGARRSGGVRRSRAGLPSGARRARRAPPRGRGHTPRGAAGLRRRAHARVRLGPRGSAGGRRRRGRARRGDVRPVRAATPRAAVLPARGARPLLRRRAAREAGRGTGRVARAPGRAASVDRFADAKRRFGCQTYEELLARAAAARAELAALDAAADPATAAAALLVAAEERVHTIGDELRAERNAAAPAFADAVAAELRDIGMGDGEFVCELRERDDPGATGADDAVFLVRPNAGLAFAPVAETASGGELSRIALAIAAVAGGDTLVFDEIDAGIGGETAHAVGRLLQRLAERAQVVTITHLPQIAALADRHFRVEKTPGDPTHTRIEQLGDDERKAELERMLGGQEFLAAVRG